MTTPANISGNPMSPPPKTACFTWTVFVGPFGFFRDPNL